MDSFTQSLATAISPVTSKMKWVYFDWNKDKNAVLVAHCEWTLNSHCAIFTNCDCAFYITEIGFHGSQWMRSHHAFAMDVVCDVADQKMQTQSENIGQCE